MTHCLALLHHIHNMITLGEVKTDIEIAANTKLYCKELLMINYHEMKISYLIDFVYQL